MSTLLEQAIERIKAGDITTAKNLLSQELNQNPRNEQAWLASSYCVSDVNQKRYCLERALAINPNNENARRELGKLPLSPTFPVQTPVATAKQATVPSPVQSTAPIIPLPSISTSSIKEQPTSTTVRLPASISSTQKPNQKQQAISKSPANKNARPQKKKGISPIIWVPIVVALIGLCGTGITVFFNPDLISRIIGLVSPRPDNFTISVHVADKSGSTISGAKVLFFYPAGSLSQYTDSNGVSTFNVNNAGQGNLRVIVETDNYQIFEKQVVYPIETTIDARLSEKQGNNKNIILRAVTDGNNVPIGGIDVVVSLDGNLYRQTTDSDGFAMLQLPFPSEGEINTQISVNAQGYSIENQFSTLTPGKLQYILLTPNSLRIEAPNIPASANSNTTSPISFTPTQTLDTSVAIIGSGIEMSQKAGDSGLKIVMLTPNSKPWKDAYLEVYEHKNDAVGNPSKGNRVTYGRINEQGDLFFDLGEGMYAICPGDTPGYGWTDNWCIFNVQVVQGSQTLVVIQPGQIEVTVMDASGNPWKDFYCEIYTQTQDATGKPVTDNRSWYGRTDNTGNLWAWLTPGLYAVKFDLAGYNWGDLSDAYGKANVPVKKGELTPISIIMGQIAIGLKNSDGQPSQDVYLEVYTQKKDVNGQPVLNNRVWYGRTDNGGIAIINLTEGMYVLKNDNNILYNIPVNWGIITQTDGKTFEQIK